MAITNKESGTNVNEIADGIYRISTPVTADLIPGGFTFNQYLIVDDAPLLFHTGLRKMFPLVREAVAQRHPGREAELHRVFACRGGRVRGAEPLAGRAPKSVPLCGRVAASVSIEDLADRMPREIKDRETLSLGTHRVQWLDAPHLPHAWECGFLMEEQTRTLLCGDLFTQGGDKPPALTESDILGPSEAFRARMDYFSYTRNARAMIERLAACAPATLACMHGSAWRGDGAALLRSLADVLTR